MMREKGEGGAARRRATPVDPAADRYEALLEVLEQQAERSAEDRALSARGTRRSDSWRYLLLGALLILSAWFWIAPPAWVQPGVPVRPVAEEEASLRFGMYLQAQRIRAFQMERGRLPLTLAEAGPPLPGMSYVRTGEGVYELTGTSDRLALTYRSTEPLASFVGDGAEVVDETRLR